MGTIQEKVSNAEILYPVEHVRDSGVQVSNDLSWSRYICNMVSKAGSKLSWFFSVFKIRDNEFMITLYKSLT